ncbi:signal-regulatory protein beta-2-like [Neolamprologus brichardi]|uniref:signal-regulatory protein beta-2-like n=1 Tax=Neolamprologus brichardi TaxID=32507 RepID=UPI0016438B84|nr:signal-regulatory protein beta-2-like [Neolamprologus brichardi]
MVMLRIILLLLHQGYALVPVKTVQLGEPANITCALPSGVSIGGVHWYKQSVGDTLKLIVSLLKTATPQYGQETFKSRFQANYDKKFSNLTILKAVQDDEGIYHCGIIEWINPEWTGTYLLVKGNNETASDYTVVQWPTVLNPLRSGNSMTLQCSVYSDSDKMCPRDYNVFWFRAGSDPLHPSIIYTDGNRHSESEIMSDSEERCLYRFSKNVSSSDAGTYYCAVATCGEILFGNGTKLDVEGFSMEMSNSVCGDPQPCPQRYKTGMEETWATGIQRPLRAQEPQEDQHRDNHGRGEPQKSSY